MNMISRLDRFFTRYYPDPIVFTIALTLLTLGVCVLVTDITPSGVLDLWGDGLPGLLTFMGQLSLTLVFSHTLANTDIVSSGLKALSRLPGSARQAYLLVVLITCGLSLITWSLGLVGGAIVARTVAQEAGTRDVKLNYPLLVAAAYASTCIWHMGYSSSAALFVATEGHALQESMGVIPVTDTVFTTWNGMTILCAILALCMTVILMHSRDQTTDAPTVEPETVEAPKTVSGTPAERVENSRWLTLILAASLAVYLGQAAFAGELAIDLNTVNWSLLLACLIFVRSPKHLVDSIGKAGPVVAPILLHYPFYAGMMAVMIGSGLVSILASGIVASASPETLPLLAFLSGGLLNIFIPSGGGQWAVQGPIFIEAANALDVPPSHIVMAVAYGDQWTNLIQPFWALPMLAIAGLEVRQILGYCVFFLLSLGTVLAGGLLITAML